MAHCIFRGSKEFKELQKETNLHEDVLSVKIELWQKNKINELEDKEDINNVLDSFPTKEEIGYQKLQISDIFTADEVDDLVNGYVYFLTQSNLSPEIDTIEFDKTTALKKVLASMKKQGNNHLADIIVEEELFNDIYSLGDEFLESLGIKIEKTFNNELEEENEDGGIDIQESYERDPSSIANSDMLIFLSLVPKFKISLRGASVFDKSELTGIPKFLNANEVKNTLYAILSNNVTDNTYQDGYQVLHKKLEEYADKNPTIKWVLKSLDQRTEKFKTNFYQVFNNADLTLFSVLLDSSTDTTRVRIQSSSIQNDETSLFNKWVSAHTYKLITTTFNPATNGYDYVYDKNLVKDINSKYEEIKNVLVRKSLENEDLESLKKSVLNYFEMLGITLTDNQYYELLSTFYKLDTFKGKNPTNLEYALQGLKNLFTREEGIRYITTHFLKMEKENNYNVKFNEKLGKNDNAIEDQKFTRYLASVVNKVENSTSSPIILGAKGKKYWNKIKYNLITKNVLRWKNNKALLKSFVDSSLWAKNSLIADAMLKDEADIQVKIFNNFKEVGKNDEGEKVTNLKESELLVAHFNMTLQNNFVGLAEADKSMQYVLSGFPTQIINPNDIKFENGRLLLSDTENIVIETMLDYLADELNRIIQTYDDLYDENNKERENIKDKIEYLHTQKNGLNSYLFPSLTNKNRASGNSLLTELGLADAFGKPFPITKEYLLNNEGLKVHIKNAFEEALNKDIKLFSTNYLIDKVYNENKEFISYDSRFKPVEAVASQYESFNQMFATFVFNSMVGSIEMSKLFLGDPAAFKSKGLSLFSDITKRIPLIVASGNIARIYEDKANNVKVNPTFTSAVTNTSKGPSRFYFNENGTINEEIIDNLVDSANSILPIERQIAKAAFKSSIEAYRENNKADAQSWITLDLWKQRWASFKGWDANMEAAYQRLKTKNANLNDIALVLQPIKTVTTELKVNKNKQTYAIYQKMSEAVLPDFLFEDFRLQHIIDTMNKNKVDQLVTLDAQKVGAVNVNTFFDKTGQPIDNVVLETFTVNTDSTVLQLDMPLKGLKDTLIGSQLTKNALSGVILNASYVSPITGKEVLGKDLILEYHNLIADLSDEGLQELSSKMGIDTRTKEINDYGKLFDFIAESLQDDLSSSDIEMIVKYKTLDVVPGATIKIQNTINKAIKKHTVSLKQKGGSGILMSGVGLINGKDLFTKEVKNGIVWLKDDLTKGLSPSYVTKEGSSYKTQKVQILIGHKEIRKILGDKLNNLTSKKISKLIDPKVLEGVMYRIPNQSLASNDVFEIVGILPDFMGDTIIAFDEITTKTGSDFDIDKAYYILPNLEVNEKGIISLPKTPNEMSDVEAYFTKFKKDWSKYKSARKIRLELENNEKTLKEKKYYLKEISKFKSELALLVEQKNEEKQKLTAEKTSLNEMSLVIENILKSNISELNNDIKATLENLKNYKEAIDELNQEIEQDLMDRLLEEGLIPTLEEFKQLPFNKKATKEVLQNKRLEFLNTFLGDPRHLARVVKPIDNDILKKLIIELHGEEDLNANDDLNFWKGTTQLKTKQTFDMAKSMVGIIANGMTDHNVSIPEMLTHIGVVFGRGIQEKGESLVSAIMNEDNVEVSEVLNDFMNAIVDAAKDPFIVRGNVNLYTANTVFMLVRAGVPLNFVMAFIGQPVLKQLSFLKSTREGRVAENMYENGLFVKPEDELMNSLFDRLSESQINDIKFNSGKINLSSFDLGKLENNIKIHQVSPSSVNVYEQALILKYFLKLMGNSKNLNNSLKVTKEDVNGPGKVFIESYIKEENIKQELKEPKIRNLDKKLGLTYSSVFDTLLENEDRKMFGAYFMNGTKIVNNMSSDISLTNSQSFKNILSVVKALQKSDIFNNQDLIEEMQKEFLSLVLSMGESPINLKNSEKLNYFKGQNSVARLLLKFTTDSNNKEFVLNNPFLKMLGTNLSNKKNLLDVITFNKNSSYTEKELKSAWEALDNHSKEGRMLARKLALYSFTANSFSSGLYTFHEYMPSSYISLLNIHDLVIDGKNTLESNNTGKFVMDMLEQIVRNNKESKLIRTVPANKKDFKVYSQLIPNISNDLLFVVNNKDFLSTFALNEDLGIYPMFVKKKKSGKTNPIILYKFIGLDQGYPVYRAIKNLGLEGKGFKIKEYDKSVTKTSAFQNLNTNPLLFDMVSIFSKFEKQISSFAKMPSIYKEIENVVITEKELDDLINNCKI
jgi:hypothetical protein